MAEGDIAFPGIIAPQYAIATRTTGARPDTCVIFAVPQDSSADTTGTALLSLSFNGVTVNWTDCLCNRGTATLKTKGNLQVFEIQDRRWRWRKAWITRAYNVRQPDGSVDTATQATVKQIATDIFLAMGESSVDLLAINSTDNPEVVLDRDNCVDAIEELLIPRGYVISLNTDNTVTVYRKGTGVPIPANDDVASLSFTIDPPEVPFYLTAVASKTIVQSKLKCVAVGEDTDGSIKLVNDLSYVPAGGWDGTDSESFDFITDPLAKECAKRSVWKWYQVTSQADGTFNLRSGTVNYCPGEIVVTSPWQYLPLEPKQVSASDDIYGKKRFNPAFVEGMFYGSDGVPSQDANCAAFTVLNRRDWTLDKERGIVMFKEVAFKKNPGPSLGVNTFADVYLTCSYAVHDNTSFVKDRQHVTRILGGIGEDLHKLDELQRQLIVSYSTASSSVSSIDDNSSTVTTAANAFLDSAQQKYSTTAGNVVLYRGIYGLSTDGITLQIRWDVAARTPCPFGTWISQYCEGLPLLPTEQEKFLIRRANMNNNPTNARNARYHNSLKRLR